MKTIEITITAKVPVEATAEQIREWVQFSVRYGGGISLKNPLVDHELEATSVSIR
jgi:hypothetical protein